MAGPDFASGCPVFITPSLQRKGRAVSLNVTLDGYLVEDIDAHAKRLGITRSSCGFQWYDVAVTRRENLRKSLHRVRMKSEPVSHPKLISWWLSNTHSPKTARYFYQQNSRASSTLFAILQSQPDTRQDLI
jgi:hypothetical protein